jgi:hypothetical protein
MTPIELRTPTAPSLSSVTRVIRAVAASALLLTAASACSAQRTAPPLVMAAVGNHDAVVVTAFRALLDEVIGDSAERVCVSIAQTSSDGTTLDADPDASVLRGLRGGRATVLPRSVCAADERNFGNPLGLLRLRDVSAADDHTLIVHAEAIGDHSARYECLVPADRRAAHKAQCRITARDWPGSQYRG